MARRGIELLAGLVLALSFSGAAKDIQFCGYTWTLKEGRGGPGPNSWDPSNVWLDSATNLHLKISQRGGQWFCAEVAMRERLGLGRYEFQTRGALNALDPNVVLGLFNYPTRDVGPDGTHEIDIEFARWGKAENPVINFSVCPVDSDLKQVTKAFSAGLIPQELTHRFTWSRTQVGFQALPGFAEDEREAVARWLYQPPVPARTVSQQPMPVHINLWLFRGQPPKDGREVEVVIRHFRFTPEQTTTNRE
jgi:hypothetical protein